MSTDGTNPIVDHREFLFMGIGWQLMDLRQDYEMAHLFSDGMKAEEIIARLWELQNMCAEYANEHFPVSVDREGSF